MTPSTTSAPTTTTASTASSGRSGGSRRSIPECNYVDIMTQDLAHLRAGEPILKPVYRHTDGTFGSPVYVEPGAVRGRRGPARLPHGGDPAHLRRPRLPGPAGGAAAEVEGRARLLAPRLHDGRGAERARPPRGRTRRPSSGPSRRTRTSSSRSGQNGTVDDELLDAELVLRPTLEHPDLSPFIDDGRRHQPRGARPRVARAHPGEDGPQPGARDRGGDLGAHALRQPPPLRAPRRVHARHRAPPVRVPRARPAPHPLPPGHGESEPRPRGREHARAGPARSHVAV